MQNNTLPLFSPCSSDESWKRLEWFILNLLHQHLETEVKREVCFAAPPSYPLQILTCLQGCFVADAIYIGVLIPLFPHPGLLWKASQQPWEVGHCRACEREIVTVGRTMTNGSQKFSLLRATIVE